MVYMCIYICVYMCIYVYICSNVALYPEAESRQGHARASKANWAEENYGTAVDIYAFGMVLLEPVALESP